MSEVLVGATRITLIQGDITRQAVDAVVNAANSSLMGGGGVDGAIHSVGGPDILKECRRIRETTHPNGLPAGQAVITSGGRLPAKHVIHTVGPVWHGGGAGESHLLESAYVNSLLVAVHNHLRTVAFPSISTGIFGYPIELAAEVALGAILLFVQEHPGQLDEVRMVLFRGSDLEVYQGALQRVTARKPGSV